MKQAHKSICGAPKKRELIMSFLNPIQPSFISESKLSIMLCLPLCYQHIFEETCSALSQRRFKMFLSNTESIGLQKGTIKYQPQSLVCWWRVLSYYHRNVGWRENLWGLSSPARKSLWPSVGQVTHSFARWILETSTDGDSTPCLDMLFQCSNTTPPANE